MFKEDLIVDTRALLNNEYIFYAHTSKESNDENETLHDHTNRCIKHFRNIIKARHLDLIFKRFENIWFPKRETIYVRLFKELIINTIVFHDIGKINPLFQSIKMNNPMFKNEQGNISLGSEHSIISTIIYLEYFLSKSNEFSKEIRRKFRIITYINAYVISKHHGNLSLFEKFLDSFDCDADGDNIYKASIIRGEYKKYFNDDIDFLKSDYCERCIGTVKRYEPTSKEDSIYLYAYEKLLYSLLVASDYYATSEYNNKFVVMSYGTIENINKINEIFNNTDINLSIEKYRKTKYKQKDLNTKCIESSINIKDLNDLRSELYLDAEHELLKNIDENIFYLEAPTGSGKSNVAFNLSFRIIEYCQNINKIMYIYPFNTLVEQNLNTVEKLFGNEVDIISNISVVNSITPLIKEGDNKYSFDECEKALLDRQFFNYPITLSTHVTLFDIMFSKHKESGFAFYQLANSVIVLDEIQSYKNTIWTEIISFLKGFAKVLNMKIIIMSATLPDLDVLSKEQNAAVKLVTNPDKYFQHPAFKERVVLNYDLFDNENVIDELNKRIKKILISGKKVLVEFIKKKSAIEFYKNFIVECEASNDNFRTELMTGDDSNAERKRILYELNNTEDGVAFLLVATQVIEAGVDLNNIDIGFKDISKLDSEEQFMGRVNRSCRTEGIVYFFDYDNAKTLYKSDVRINDELTLKSEHMRELLKEKKFEVYYRKVLEMISVQNESTVIDKNIREFFFQVGRLNTPVVSDRMKLIDDDDWSCTVFLSRELFLDSDEKIDGKEVWNDYKYLLKNKRECEYAQWRIKLSIVKSKMNNFTYQVNRKSSFPYTEQLGEIFYIEDAEQYFEGDKFIRGKLENQIGAFI